MLTYYILHSIFPKAAGVLHISYWFKRFRNRDATIKQQFPKAASNHMNGDKFSLISSRSS